MSHPFIQRFTAFREPLLLALCAAILVLAVLVAPWLALAVPLLLLIDAWRLRKQERAFDAAAYALTGEEQAALDQAAARYVDARRHINRIEAAIRQRGYRLEDDRVTPADDHARRLQADWDDARAALDPEDVLTLARLPVQRADRALQHYAWWQGNRWGLMAYPIGAVLGLPLGWYGLVVGGVASCFGFMLGNHVGSRKVINFLLSLPQAMPRFEADRERQEQARAAARSLARGRESG